MKNKIIMDYKSSYEDSGRKVEEKKHNNIIINHFMIDDNLSMKIKRSKGEYYSIHYNNINMEENSKLIEKELSKILNYFFKLYKSDVSLIIGLGNSSIAPDSLGSMTTNKIIATNQYNNFLTIPKIALFNPEVINKTGISSYDLIELVVKKVKPKMIIIIDSLGTTNKDYLGNLIEVSDTGTINKNALKNAKEINKNTFNIPVIVIGIPLILEIDNEIYTSPYINKILESSSNIISNVINKIIVDK